MKRLRRIALWSLAAVFLVFVHATPITYWCAGHIEQDQHDPFSNVGNAFCQVWWLGQ